MEATKIYYEKCFNLGNYENEKMGVEVELEQGEEAADALCRARGLINGLFRSEKDKLQEIVDNPSRYNAQTYLDAKAKLEHLEDEEYPF